MIKVISALLAVSSVIADNNLLSYGGKTWVKSSARLAGLQAVELQDKLLGDPDPADKRVAPIWRDSDVVPANNCYNFGTGIITNTFAQPGSATGKPYNPMNITCEGVITGAISDGLVPVERYNVGDYYDDKNSCHYLGLTVTDYVAASDYHWFRLMKPGYDNVEQPEWWHKPGGTPVLTTDFNGTIIKADGLEYADRGPYRVFCGYLKHCVQIR
jgi:hypothetical protein